MRAAKGGKKDQLRSMKRGEDKFMLIIIMQADYIEHAVKVGRKKQFESPSGALPDSPLRF